ncbi:MAG TPA: hypothetical protein VGN48_06705, partial [Pedococcus sp.]|nr:hypothetical protein [Pedococcus sp.]
MESPKVSATDQRLNGGTRVDDDTEVLYFPFRDWMTAKPERLIGAIAAGLILVQILVRLYLKAGTWYYIDDYAFIARADTLPLWSADYLLKGWNGHLMPGSFLWVAFLNHFWHMSYGAVIVTDTLGQIAVDVLFYRLLVSLFGSRPAILVPFTIFVITPATLPAYLWWAASINQLPGQAALIGALLLQVRYHRTGQVRCAVLGAATVLVGLLFSEKVLLAVPCVLALTFLFFTPGSPLKRLRRFVSRHSRALIGYLLVAVPYAVFYAFVVPTPVERGASLQDMVTTSSNAISHALLPGLLGGPWDWQPALGLGAYANPSPGAVLAVSIVAVMVVCWSVIRSHRAVFAWAIVGAYELVNTLLLGMSRTALFGPWIGSEYRYSTDAAVVTIVFGAMAFVGMRTDFAGDRPLPLIPRWAPEGRAVPAISETMIVGLTCSAIMVSGIVSTSRAEPFWRNTAAREFFAAAQSDIAAAKRSIPLADEDLGARVQGGLLLIYNSPSSMFAGFHPTPTFLRPGSS